MALRKRDTIGDRSIEMEKMTDYYELVDALNDGIDAMRRGGEKWLEKFPDERASDYAFRLSQTKMTNVFSDALESLASKPFEKDITLENSTNSEFLHEFVMDVDGAGNNISVFSADVFEAGIRSSIDWIFIDYPPNDKPEMTVEEKRSSGLRPYWSRIIAVNVLDVKTEMFGGTEKIIYFRYLEPTTPRNRVRELYLNADGKCQWVLYEEGDQYDEKTETAYQRIDGGITDIEVVPIVPFVTGRRIGRSYVTKPPMKAAADAQRDLYHQESALKYAKVLAAYPMLSGNGVNPPKDKDGKPIPLGIGPQRVLYAPPNSDGSIGSWKYVEPNANTLDFLAKDINNSIQNLRELARQPLTAQSSNLTTVTTAFAAGKSKSSVAAWAGKLKDALENALWITCLWEGDDTPLKDITVYVYTDFDQFVDGKDLEELRAARDAGDISQETYWEEIKRRGLVADSFTPERERLRLLDDTPSNSREVIIEA